MRRRLTNRHWKTNTLHTSLGKFLRFWTPLAQLFSSTMASRIGRTFVTLSIAVALDFSSRQVSCANDAVTVDRVIAVVLNEAELDQIVSSSGGVVVFDYPDIQREIQRLNDCQKAKKLAMTLIKMDVSPDRQRRRVYFAIQALALKIQSEEPGDMTVGYILGCLDERIRREHETLAQAELVRGASAIRKLIGGEIIASDNGVKSGREARDGGE